MKTLVVIPAYNEQECIKDTVNSVKKYSYDYLVINDCSKDNTAFILDSENMNHLDLPMNLGLAGVTRVGFKYAHEFGYDCVVCIDGDGQHLPEYMHLLIQEIENGNDYVVGSRFVSEKKPMSMRMIGSRLLCWLIKLKTGQRVSDPTSGMRAVGRKIIAEFDKSMNYYAEPDTMCHLIRKGYKVKEIQVEMKERETGVSYFQSPFRSMHFMLCNILSIVFVQ